MGLPCAFTKKLCVGDRVMVCDHVFEENLKHGELLSCNVGKMHRNTPPSEVKYEDGSISHCDVVITCGSCNPQGKGVSLLEFVWEKNGLYAVPVGAS
jgi:hypothetical protein